MLFVCVSYTHLGHTELVQESEVLMRVEKGRKVVGSFIVTTSIADGVTGFAGKVPVVLALNTEGKIIGLRLLENQESPGFIKRIARKGFFDSWNDKTPEEALELQVEAVSGATPVSYTHLKAFSASRTITEESFPIE